MSAGLEQLVDSLLYEGYALYPYTPGVKQATPTPFGIVYPPGYAEQQPAAQALLRLEGVLAAPAEAAVAGTIRFLQVSGDGYRAQERRLELEATPLAKLAEDPVGEAFEFEGADGPLRGRVRLRCEPLAPELWRLRLCVHNSSEPPGAAELSRGEALRWSLISTHPLLRASGGRFVSPLEAEGPEGDAVQALEALNTWPVLASPEDDALLGAAIVLPDRPKLAPESLGNLFDNTEIEEALLLHVQALSEGEREQIAGQDPAVREMIDRAEQTAPEELLRLHGRLEELSPEGALSGPPNNPGAESVEVGGITFHRGGHVRLVPSPGGDPHDVVLRGREATIERIYTDYEDGIHLCVTVDGDPGQELMRDTGRYLFFRPDEVEPLPEELHREGAR